MVFPSGLFGNLYASEKVLTAALSVTDKEEQNRSDLFMSFYLKGSLLRGKLCRWGWVNLSTQSSQTYY